MIAGPCVWASQSEPQDEWEPLLGTYGWVWISLTGVALFIGYKVFQRRREEASKRQQHEEKWGQRPEESNEQWQVRVERQLAEDRQRRAEWDARARAGEQAARSRLSRDMARGSREFDPPGGWGATGPDNG